MRGKGIDYFENSRRATLAQRAYAIANPGGFAGYGADVWGLTACDGPLDGERRRSAAATRKFQTYAARGASLVHVQRRRHDRADRRRRARSPFAPEIVDPGARARCAAAGASTLCGEYGFLDAFNPTLDDRRDRARSTGASSPGVGWFDTRLPRHRPGADRRDDRELPHASSSGGRCGRIPTSCAGLRRAGFTGGWLERRAALRLARRAPRSRCPRGVAGCAREAAAPGRRARCASGRSAARARSSRELVPEFERANPGHPRRRPADPVDGRAREAADRLRRRLDAGPRAARQHLDPGVRRARRARAARRARRGLGGARARATTSRASGRRTCSTARTYGIPWYVDTRVLFYRNDLLDGRGLRRDAADVGGLARGDAQDQERRTRRTLRDPPARPTSGSSSPSSASRSGSPLLADGGTRGAFARPGFRARGRLLRRPLPARASRRSSATRSSPTSTRSSPRLLRDVDHRARGTSASSAAACRRSCRTPGRPRRCPRRTGRTGRGLRSRAARASCSSGRRGRRTRPGASSSSCRAREIQARFYALSGDLPARREAWDDPALAGDAKAPRLPRAARARRRRCRACPSGSRSRRRSPRTSRRAIRGRETVAAALAALDRDVDRMLEKRRWMLARGGAPGP